MLWKVLLSSASKTLRRLTAILCSAYWQAAIGMTGGSGRKQCSMIARRSSSGKLNVFCLVGFRLHGLRRRQQFPDDAFERLPLRGIKQPACAIECLMRARQ
jgi:hypothetical protein